MPIHKNLAALAIAGALLLAPSSFKAQDAKGKLGAAKNLKCTFPLVAVGTWNAKEPEAKVKPATLVLQFQDINADEGTARMDSTYGAYEIIVRYAGGYLHFIQSF